MWTIRELKSRGKEAFKRNYWKSVIVALLLSMLIGGGAGLNFAGASPRWNQSGSNSGSEQTYSDGTNSLTYDGDEIDMELDLDDPEDLAEIGDMIDSMPEVPVAARVAAGIAAFIVFLIIFAVVMALVFVISAFIYNPFQVGCFRFFTKNLDEDAEVSNIGYAFDQNYRNIVKTTFFRDLYIFLWSLLFIIPGIVKAYEYRMIPYLLAEDPTMDQEQAFAISKRLMKGNKWKAFLLDLSFIGWYILSLLTLGMLGIFYVDPYKNSTDAALYRKLLELSDPSLPTDQTYADPAYDAAYTQTVTDTTTAGGDNV